MDNIPYIYWLKNKSTGKKYIGVRWAKNCSPEDFWIEYFTSSPSVHKLIEIFGVEDFEYKILHTFKSAEQAILKEAKYIKIAMKRDDYLNMCHLSPSKDICSKAGKISGKIQVLQKKGIHSQTKMERRQVLEKAWAIQDETKTNAFKHCLREKQVERGRKGGPKNKGFIWLTDGKTDIKYTTKMQSNLSVDEFLKKNTTFKRGRKKNESKKS